MSDMIPEPIVMGIGFVAASGSFAVLLGAIVYTCLQAFYVRVLPVTALALGAILMFDQDTAMKTVLESTDANQCTSTPMLLKTVGALCMTYAIGTYYASKVQCQITQAYYGFAMSGVGALLVYSLWEGLSAHDQTAGIALVGGMKCLSLMKIVSPKIQKKFGVAKQPYTGF
mmetsp:Transcript_37403/g.101297  ORF Transcript_37403/g.101297 Transcript_37403/m.101297 type:complete len:171 (+) Transcript_37403:84-596(+)|eukprot:CAMPEP_0119541858 /NCGR_PEP_ID=MMETSP1344-20130328/53223_1 /TAXON_ID=236787 /ORGANISM="Florenciella parvula, Strain CCMP2471" /LENGTH=170 /DNA_ID=CAMNT_0007585941 /DNA_START=87 /DNA_END=599 /DNA_ORIENTATION=-